MLFEASRESWAGLEHKSPTRKIGVVKWWGSQNGGTPSQQNWIKSKHLKPMVLGYSHSRKPRRIMQKYSCLRRNGVAVLHLLRHLQSWISNSPSLNTLYSRSWWAIREDGTTRILVPWCSMQTFELGHVTLKKQTWSTISESARFPLWHVWINS